MSISEMRNTTTGKVVGFLAALTLVMSLVFGATYAPAQAQTNEELLADIAELLAKVDELQALLGGGTVSGDFTHVFLADLSMGSTGNDVLMLQTYLNTNVATQVATTGAGAPGMETSYYGPLTANAVTRYQQLNAATVLTPLGLASGTGYFGPSTRAHLNGEVAVSVDDADDGDDGDDDDDTSGGDLSGGEGFITVNDLSVGSVEIDTGDTATVVEVDVEAVDSDVELNRVDFMFDSRPWLYFSEVRLMVDGTEVAVLDDDSDNFSEVGSEWRARFSGLDEVVREDETVEVSLELEVHETLAGTRASDTVVATIDEDGIRFVDAAGIIGYGPDADADVADVDVTFDDNFNSGTLDVTSSTNTPDETILQVDTDGRTDDVHVLTFDAEAENQDITVNEADFVVTTGSSDDNDDVSDVVRRLRLYADGDLIGTESVPSTITTHTGTVTFDNLDYVIAEDDEVEFTVEVDLYQASGDFDTLPGTFEIELDEIRAENEDFAAVTGLTSIGIGAGTQHDVVTTTAVVTDWSQTTSVNSDGYRGTFTLEFDVTAVEADYYLDNSVANVGTTPTAGFAYSVIGGGSGADSENATVTTTSGADTGTSGSWLVREGQTETFRVQVVLENAGTTGPEGFYGIQLDEYFITTNADGTTSAASVDVTGQSIETDEEYIGLK